MPVVAPHSFSLSQKLLHWVTVLLVFFNLLFADGMTEWWDVTHEDGGSATADMVSSANIHAYVGIAILLLTLGRLILRFVQGVPAAPVEEPAIFRKLSAIGHAGIYGLLLLMPLLGIWAYYLGNTTAAFLHEGPLKVLFWLLILVHIAAALVHQFYWKTNVLARMTHG